MKPNLQTPFDGNELAIAAAAALVWSLLGMSLAIREAQSTGDWMSQGNRSQSLCDSVELRRQGAAANVQTQVNLCQVALPTTTGAAACRVQNQLGGGANVGSGTLIDVTPDGERGLVLTCAHLFTEGVGQLAIEFPGGKRHGARIVAIDAQADLAALEISRPAQQAVELATQAEPQGNLSACGFGPNGAYRCITGAALGYAQGPGQTSVKIGGAVRSGDSGGGVFDARGRLVAVVWGESDGVTYASTGRPLRQFLERVLGRRTGRAPAFSIPLQGDCPDGTCPLINARPQAPPTRPALPMPTPPASPSVVADQPCDCGDALAAIAARLEAFESRAPPSSPAASDANSGVNSAGDDRGSTAAWSHVARAAAVAATTLLGVSGPAGWGVVAASTLGGWLLGRRIKARKRRGKSRGLREEEAPLQRIESSDSRLAAHGPPSTAPGEATAAAERAFPARDERGDAIAVAVQAPIERDDREARELLRLSQLEGRDPLQDAVAGRIALDRLDALAESDADPPQAAWADRLRRELRERFNEIAPTKFKLGNDE